MSCSLCGSQTRDFSVTHKRTYSRCVQCDGISLHPSYYLSKQLEKQRYDAHHNDVNDSGYQSFVSPIIQSVVIDYDKTHKGLDFGSGSGPVVTMMLRDKGFDVQTFDPFFDPNTIALKTTYDYIICCEVMEHFYHPDKEFKLLRSLLNPNGTLYCKTNVYNDTINFDTWWYKNDATHVFFYTKKTIHWIKKEYNFNTVFIRENLITFKR